MTTTATKRMRFAALGLTTALSIGGLAPFIGQGEASAATSCTTATSQYTAASSRLAHDKHKLHKAKHKLHKAKKHHRSHKVIKHRKHKVKHLKRQVRADRHAKSHYYTSSKNCTTTMPGGGTTSPLDLTSLLGALGTSGVDPDALTNALNALAAEIAAQGANVPGSNALSDGIKAIADAIANNASSLSPAEIQKLLSELPTDLANGPAALQAALQDAVGGLTSALENPPSTASGLIDAVLTPVSDGLNEFQSSQPLADVVDSVRSGLDTALNDLGLPALGGLSSTSGSPVDVLSQLSPDQASAVLGALDPSTLTTLLTGLASADPTQLESLLGGFDSSQLQGALGGLNSSQLQQLIAADPTGLTAILTGLLSGLLG